MEVFVDWADAISWKKVRELLPEAAAEFEAVLMEFPSTLDDFCRQYAEENFSVDDEDVVAAWDKVAQRFKDVTGLKIVPTYLDPESGVLDRARALLTVEGVWQMTPEAETIKDMLWLHGWATVG